MTFPRIIIFNFYIGFFELDETYKVVKGHVVDMKLKFSWEDQGDHWSFVKLVQIHKDTNCYNSYDSKTCLNMFKHV